MTSPELFLANGCQVTREDLKRMLPALGYFVRRGVMPDSDLARKIREHPSSLKELTGEAGREVLVCHQCESLHYWRQEPHDQCGHMLRPLEEAAPETLERILRNIIRNWRIKIKHDILRARYPLPKENYPDQTYTCLVCKKVFKLNSCNDPDRLACSPRHLFELMGHPWPKGRKWPGFLTFWPTFRRGEVLYFGKAVVREKKCECYLWKMVPGATGSFYVYYGAKENDYRHWIAGAYANRADERSIMDAGHPVVDESWRIVANTRKTYDWK